LIYGSVLSLTYEIRITNTSDINYYETDENYYGWYYMFGETGSYSKEASISIDEAIDFYEPSLKYVSGDEKIKEITYSSSSGWSSSDGKLYTISETSEDKLESISGNKLTDYKKALVMPTATLTRKDAETVTLSFEKTLSTSDDDLSFTNIVLVDDLSNKGEEGEVSGSFTLIKNPTVPEPAEAYLAVSAPTGGDKQSIVIYTITGIVALVILVTGIVIIKKKVL
jgi:hypothetical protein